MNSRNIADKHPIPGKGFPGGFTVLMSTYQYDDPELLRLAIDSVINNTLPPDDFLLVIDGFVPAASNAIILDFENRGLLRTLRLLDNQGLALALNSGLREIKTEWVVRADADDINFTDRFESHAISISKSTEILDIVGGGVQEINKEGKLQGFRIPPGRHSEILKYSKFRSPFNHNAVAYRLKPVIDCGGYPNIYLKEDYGLWLKLLSSGCIAHNSPVIMVNALAGSEMHKRRGGFKYVLSEISLQRFAIKYCNKPFNEAFFSGILRSLFFLSPYWCKGAIYRKFLRQK